MRCSEFFYGLTGEGLGDTINQYTHSDAWRVHTMGCNDEGFWILFEAVSD